MFAVLQVTDFPLQAVLRMEPALLGRPVALLDDRQRPPVIVACTAEARAQAVQLGSTSPQAMARCPGIELRSRRTEAEAEARAGLLATAFSVAPQVEDTAPGVCTLQMGGVAAGEREPALRRAIAQLAGMGLIATAGLAPTPLLALYAARFGGAAKAKARRTSNAQRPTANSEPGTDSSSPGAATPSSQCPNRRDEGVASPGEHAAFPAEPGMLNLERGAAEATGRVTGNRDDGVGSPDADGASRICGLLTSTQVRTFLRDLPLAVAEPAPETAPILAGWGIRTLGQLTALTKADVTQRLGPAGLALWERAAGAVDRPLRLVNPPQVFEAGLELEEPVETLEPVLFLLRRFIDRLALELRNAGYVAGEMTLALKLADETEHRREFRLPEPTAREEILFRVLHTHLEALHTAAEVAGVRLACRPVRPLNRQQGLFESALRDPHGFAETLARVAAVVGPDRVGTPVLENTHRPDAVRLEPPPPVVAPVSATTLPPQYGPPLRRLRPAVAAKVELQDQTPVFVWTAQVAGAVRALAGPWRGSGDWWDPAHRWQREEWDVELDSGGLYRLLHTPEGWFVEGEYD